MPFFPILVPFLIRLYGMTWAPMPIEESPHDRELRFFISENMTSWAKLVEAVMKAASRTHWDVKTTSSADYPCVFTAEGGSYAKCVAGKGSRLSCPAILTVNGTTFPLCVMPHEYGSDVGWMWVFFRGEKRLAGRRCDCNIAGRVMPCYTGLPLVFKEDRLPLKKGAPPQKKAMRSRE